MGFVQVGGERERGRIAGKIFKNLLLPCLCIRRGEEYAQYRLKRHRVFFFFMEKRKMNLGVTQKWVMTKITNHFIMRIIELEHLYTT
jgi:hypothetical protein